MLTLTNLRAGYGPVSVLRDVSFEVAPGEIVAILGPNGAGKTTLLRTLSGLIRPTQGSIEFDGRDVTRLAAHRRARAGLLHVPEGRGIFDVLSVEENLLLGGQFLARAVRVERMGELMDMFPILGDRRDSKAGLLSGGQQQILAVARGLMSSPKVLMIDEPTMGLAPVMVAEIIESLRGILDQGTSILLSEQNAAVAAPLATRLFVLTNGELSSPGVDAESPDDLFAAYLR